MYIFLVPIVLLIIIIIFAFPQFSPIPYFPSNYKDKNIILKSLNIANNQTIIDLGAGDGWVIFEGAKIAYQKKLNTKFVAVEINPILTCILYIKFLFNPNRANIKIIRDSFFSMNFSKLLTKNYKLTTIYIYISPWLIEKTLKIIRKNFKSFTLSSYYYPIKSLKKIEHVDKGIHNIYTYMIK